MYDCEYDLSANPKRAIPWNNDSSAIINHAMNWIGVSSGPVGQFGQLFQLFPPSPAADGQREAVASRARPTPDKALARFADLAVRPTGSATRHGRWRPEAKGCAQRTFASCCRQRDIIFPAPGRGGHKWPTGQPARREGKAGGRFACWVLEFSWKYGYATQTHSPTTAPVDVGASRQELLLPFVPRDEALGLRDEEGNASVSSRKFSGH